MKPKKQKKSKNQKNKKIWKIFKIYDKNSNSICYDYITSIKPD